MINRPGTFIAEVTRATLQESGKPPKATLVLDFKLAMEVTSDGHVELENPDLTIKNWNYLETNTLELNTITIDNLKKVFGWPGTDLEWLEENIISQGCQIVIAMDLYNGTEKARVKYINKIGDSGGEATMPASERKALTARLGSKLRSYSPPQKVAAPNPVTPPPAMPKHGKPKAVAAAKPAPMAERPLTDNEVWAAFVALHPGENEEVIGGKYFDLMDAVCGTDQPTQDDLVKLMNKITNMSVEGPMPPMV